MNDTEDTQEKKRRLCGQVLDASGPLTTAIMLRCPDGEKKKAALKHVAQAVTLAKEAIEEGER